MSVIGPRPGLWNQDILTAERDKYNAISRQRGFDSLQYMVQLVVRTWRISVLRIS